MYSHTKNIGGQNSSEIFHFIVSLYLIGKDTTEMTDRIFYTPDSRNSASFQEIILRKFGNYECLFDYIVIHRLGVYLA